MQRNLASGGFIAVPRVVVADPEVDALAVAVYVHVCSYPEYWGSQSALARETGLSVRAVGDRLGLLVERDHLEITRRRGRPNAYAPTGRGLDLERSARGLHQVQGPAHQVQGGAHQVQAPSITKRSELSEIESTRTSRNAGKPTREELRAVECDDCGAGAGEPCRGERAGRNHPARWRLWEWRNAPDDDEVDLMLRASS